MLNGAPSEFDHARLRPRTSVDSVCAMGTGLTVLLLLSTTFKNSHTAQQTRGLFCAQLLACMLDPFAKPAIARHLAADFIDAVNDC